MILANKKYIISSIFLAIACLVLLMELIRDCTRNGDFIGYITTGNLVLAHKDIYSEWLNTWPPFYAVFCVPLSLVDGISPILIRLLWLGGSLVSMYFIIKLTIGFIFHKPLTWSRKGDGIKWQDPLIVIPLLISLRFIMENMANLQINIFMLLLACLALYYFMNNKYYAAGFLLALSISLKIYTIFFLFYFMYKREWKTVMTTSLFLLLINAIPFFVFGFATAQGYYIHWFNMIASNPPTSIHLNQSVFGLVSRLITSADPENNFYVNFLSLKHPFDTYVKYTVLFLAAIYPAFLFRKKLNHKNGMKTLIEYSFLFSIIPLASTLAWKAYFIFLWFPYLLIYVLLFRTPSTLTVNKQRLLKLLFLFSIVLNVFTSDGIIGKRASDILQSLSCITIGTVLLVIIQLIIYRNIEKFNTTSLTES